MPETVESVAPATTPVKVYARLETPIHEAASSENARFAIKGVMLREEPGRFPVAVATDGKVLAIVQAGTDKGTRDAQAIVPVAAVKVARGAKTRKGGGPAPVVVADVRNASCEVTDPKTGAAVTHRTIEGTFPPYQDVVPKFPVGAKSAAVVSLNAETLHRLANAIGAEGGAVHLLVEMNAQGGASTTRAIGVLTTTAASVTSLGVMMPLTADAGDVLKRWEETRAALA